MLCFEITLLRLAAIYVEVKHSRVSKMYLASHNTMAEPEAAPWLLALQMSVFEPPHHCGGPSGNAGNATPLMPFKQDCPPGSEANCSDERGKNRVWGGKVQRCKHPCLCGLFQTFKKHEVEPRSIFSTSCWPLNVASVLRVTTLLSQKSNLLSESRRAIGEGTKKCF